jgi:hypothetical protein
MSDLSFYSLSEMIDIFLSFYEEETFLLRTELLDGDLGDIMAVIYREG